MKHASLSDDGRTLAKARGNDNGIERVDSLHARDRVLERPRGQHPQRPGDGPHEIRERGRVIIDDKDEAVAHEEDIGPCPPSCSRASGAVVR